MAEDTQNTRATRAKNEAIHTEAKEDAETRATRRELKQSSISDPSASTDKEQAEEKGRPETPDNDDLKDQVASPKKKRAHDQLDSSKDNDDKESVASADSSKDRADRSEPEKKRARDEDGKEQTKDTKDKEDGDGAKETTETAPGTSASAFAASGFGKLAASGTSGFGSLGGTKLSSFGSPNKTPLTSFGSAGASSSTSADASGGSAPKLTFGGASSASPFGNLPTKTNGFGSALGGGSAFSSLGDAKPLSTFGSGGAVKPLGGQKTAKAFGAPESDVEESDEQESEGEGETPASDNERAGSPEKDSGDKKKLKLQKIDVDDGEAAEATLIAVRAKIFAHEKETGWKERGAGILKINVPNSCVEFEDSGAVVAGSFDASGLDEEDEEGDDAQPKVIRLVMRQDHTHRVILNTAIVPAMKFQEKASLKSVNVLFTAFEGDDGKPVAITMRMSAANAKIFMNEIGNVQRELQNR